MPRETGSLGEVAVGNVNDWLEKERESVITI